ncbi:hypothetical protein TNIN_88161 [Trichonephila inaurata madagascariensis]|uniref:Uncharacterized protein n=1 Tax=Trichonephila inaurata madagascariensis TaxID=2747483 RepID=A0A8X7BR36_9ARAC|nr:hypothetical protein TNIN_88161 [Trichonephila inaurata madagascariensis]
MLGRLRSRSVHALFKEDVHHNQAHWQQISQIKVIPFLALNSQRALLSKLGKKVPLSPQTFAKNPCTPIQPQQLPGSTLQLIN